MKTRASLKKRTPDCKIVRRKGRLFVINKKNPKRRTLSTKCVRVNVKNAQNGGELKNSSYLCMLFSEKCIYYK